MQIQAGARGWCDPIWLIDADDASAAAVRPLLHKFGTVVDALGASPEAAAEALRPHAPDGLAIFYDTGMEHVAEIAAALGVPFHSVPTARALEDKLHQRRALAAAGLPTPAVVALPENTGDRREVERLAQTLAYPAILKPRRASGSWHTLPVRSPREAAERWAELTVDAPEALVVEEYLPDGPAMPGGFEADYVSVETVASGGRLHHLAIPGASPSPRPSARPDSSFRRPWAAPTAP